jgi:tetratricopeptide (TPR) repeat protein
MADNPRIDELRRRVQRDPASIAFAALADEYRRAGLYHDAIETCRAGLQRHPAYLSARVTLGRALLEIGEYQEATQHLEQVLRFAPENLAAIRALAEIHRRNGEPAETVPESVPQSAASAPVLEPVPQPVAPPAAEPVRVSAPAAAPAPLKLVSVAADREVSARPPTSTVATPRASDPVPVASGRVGTAPTPVPRLLVVEDLELFLAGIRRARQSLGA